MTIEDKLTNKIIISVSSVILTAIIVLLYFLDTSLDWNALKITSCIIVSFWSLFFIPSFRFIYLKYKDMTIEQSFKIGLHIAINGFFLPFLLAPYYGLKYYFTKNTKKENN